MKPRVLYPHTFNEGRFEPVEWSSNKKGSSFAEMADLLPTRPGQSVGACASVNQFLHRPV